MINRKNRFHGRGSLRFVYQHGETTRGSLFALKSITNKNRENYRMAVVVSRKVHKSAVVRNHIRRRTYETVRQVADQIHGGHDLVFTVYSDQMSTCDYETVSKQILDQLQKAGVLSPKNPTAK